MKATLLLVTFIFTTGCAAFSQSEQEACLYCSVNQKKKQLGTQSIDEVINLDPDFDATITRFNLDKEDYKVSSPYSGEMLLKTFQRKLPSTTVFFGALIILVCTRAA